MFWNRIANQNHFLDCICCAIVAIAARQGESSRLNRRNVNAAIVDGNQEATPCATVTASSVSPDTFARTPIVETIASFAVNPEIDAATGCHSPNPSGANSGAITPPIAAIKLSALGIKNALALSLAYAKENPKVKGKTSLDRLLREGKELKIIALQSKDVGQFKELAKQYGVLFAVVKDKAQNEKVDVMFKAEDVSKLNRIYEQLGYAIPKVTTADRKKDPTRRQSDSSLLTRGKNPLDIDPRPSVRATIMKLKNAAQKAAQAQEKVQNITAKEER